MAVTIYVLHDTAFHETYIWHEPNRHDPAARIAALKKLEPGTMGRLYRGPTGVDKMESLGTVYRPEKK